MRWKSWLPIVQHDHGYRLWSRVQRVGITVEAELESDEHVYVLGSDCARHLTVDSDFGNVCHFQDVA